MNTENWFEAANVADLNSPALLVYPDRVQANIRRMLELVDGDVARLRPHVKTHKMPEVVRLQIEAGIGKFKCATIAEAEMTAQAGAGDVLLAYQPVGPNIARFAALTAAQPKTRFSAIVDSPQIVDEFAKLGGDFALFVDIDCGMGRTGIAAEDAPALCQKIRETSGVSFAGIHAYDGHVHHPNPEDRRAAFEAAMEPVRKLVAETEPPEVVGGGSPTFALHGEKTWQCSPGTTLLWDAGYGTKFPDLGFELAAVLLTRVASKPGKNRVCLDLGHKAIAAENPMGNRVRFLNLEGATPVMQSEEHLVLELEEANREAVNVGDPIYAVPWHICPTVALHEEAQILRDGDFTGETWKIAARVRKLTV